MSIFIWTFPFNFSFGTSTVSYDKNENDIRSNNFSIWEDRKESIREEKNKVSPIYMTVVNHIESLCNFPRQIIDL